MRVRCRVLIENETMQTSCEHGFALPRPQSFHCASEKQKHEKTSDKQDFSSINTVTNIVHQPLGRMGSPEGTRLIGNPVQAQRSAG